MPSYRIKLFGPPGEPEKPKIVDWSKSA
ncbi:MAG: hypothetical protein QOD60_1402, partial [Solirubrobacterales bacterium]|nr:hypothetical protein [Solirubrobacterales bacterium]